MVGWRLPIPRSQSCILATDTRLEVINRDKDKFMCLLIELRRIERLNCVVEIKEKPEHISEMI